MCQLKVSTINLQACVCGQGGLFVDKFKRGFDPRQNPLLARFLAVCGQCGLYNYLILSLIELLYVCTVLYRLLYGLGANKKT